MRKECADCGNERIMVCPSCNQSDAAELRQLRSEVAAFRSLAAQVDKEVALLREVVRRMEENPDLPCKHISLAALKALEAARA